MSFEEFIEWLNFSSATFLQPLPHRYQLDWFVDQNGDVIVDFIGRFEQLQADWDLISARTALTASISTFEQKQIQRQNTSLKIP